MNKNMKTEKMKMRFMRHFSQLFLIRTRKGQMTQRLLPPKCDTLSLSSAMSMLRPIEFVLLATDATFNMYILI